MREIKFRAWDKKNNKMLYSGIVLIPTAPTWSIAEDYERDDRNHDETTIDWADARIIMGNYIAMQFTGLLDKNGKEIYEKDRLRYTDDDGSILEGIVEMFRYQWGIMNDNGFYPFTYQVQTSRVDYHEVIGNEFEGE